MAATLGTLAVAITGSLSGLEKAFSDVEKKADAFGKKMSDAGKTVSNVGRGIANVGKTMTLAITAPVVGLAAGLVKTGIEFKAFKQEAKQAFSVLLGSEEEAITHMDRILDFARTTPFAFPDLVDANRKLVSFGMTADDTFPVIEAISNAVAAMGGGAQEISELADVFARIESQGKITGQELNRLGAKGINAVAIMANKAGLSMDDMRKKISSGAIDSKQAIDWLVDGIMHGTEGIAGQTVALGGSLGALKNTWAGAMDSLRGAWRWTADAIVSDEMFEKIIEGIRKLTEFVKDLPAILGPIAQTLGDIFLGIIDNLIKLADWFSNLDPETQDFYVRLGMILIAAGPVLIIVGKLGTAIGGIMQAFKYLGPLVSSIGGALTALSGPVGWIIAAIAALTAGIILLWKYNEDFRDGVIGAWEVIKKTIGPVIEMLQKSIGDMMRAMGPAFDVLKNAFMDLLPILKVVAAILGGVVAVGISIVIGVVNGLINAIAPLVQAFGGLIAFVTNVINMIVALFRGDFAGAFGYLIKAGQGLVDFVSGMVKAIWGLISGLVTGVINFFKSLYNALVGHSIIPDLINGIIGWFRGLPGKVLEFVKNMMTGIIDGIKNRVSSVTGAISSVISGIKDRIARLPGDLLQAGRNMIASLAQGIRDRISSITSAIGNVAQKIRDFLPFSPAKLGPLRILPDFGDYFARGIEDAERDISAAMSGVMGDLSAQVTVPRSSVSAVNGSRDVNLNLNFTGLPAGTDETAIKQFLLRALREPEVARRVDEALHTNTRSRLAPQGQGAF